MSNSTRFLAISTWSAVEDESGEVADKTVSITSVERLPVETRVYATVPGEELDGTASLSTQRFISIKVTLTGAERLYVRCKPGDTEIGVIPAT